MVKHAVIISTLALVACNDLTPGVLYRCEADAGCLQAGLVCAADGYCHAAGSTGGGATGGSAGGGTGGGGALGGGGGALGGGGGALGGGGGALGGGGGALGGGGGALGGGGGALGGGAGGGTGGAVGGGGGTSCQPCPSGVCGFFDAGLACAELSCGLCGAGLECGVRQANRCDTPALCMNDGWCFENPLPQGNTIHSAWAVNARLVYLAGDNGTLLRWNGERHEVVQLPTLADGTDLWSVHGTGASDVWVVGSQGTVLHFDGTAWTLRPLPLNLPRPLRAVWARPDGGALAVGRGSDKYEWTGGAFIDEASTFIPVDFSDTTSRGTQWLAVGDQLGHGSLANSNPDGGPTWVTARALPLANANSIWLSPDGGLFVGGTGDGGTGVVLHQLGDAGFEVALTLPSPVRSVRGRNSDDFYVGGDLGLLAHVVDGGPVLSQLGAGWNALAPLPNGNALAEGRFGQVALLDDAVATPVPLSSGTTLRVNELCVAEGKGLFAASQGVTGCSGASCSSLLLERVVDGGSSWKATALTLASTGEFTGCTSVIGFRWLSGDGARFINETAGGWGPSSPITPSAPMSAIHMESTVRGWAVTGAPASGEPFVSELNGSLAFQNVRPRIYDGGGDLITAVGSATGATFMVGDHGLLFTPELDGGMTALPRLGASNLRTVRGADLVDGGVLIIAAGADGARYRMEGPVSSATFIAEPEPGIDFLSSATLADGEAWAVGADSPDGGRRPSRVTRRLPNGTWVGVPYLGDQPLRSVVASHTDAGTTVWVSGPAGLIQRKDP